MLSEALFQNDVDKARNLLDKGAVHDAYDLKRVLLQGNLEVIELLAEYDRIDYDKPLNNDRSPVPLFQTHTPLSLAVKIGSIDFDDNRYNDRFFGIVLCLLEAGANPDVEHWDPAIKRYVSPIRLLSSLKAHTKNEKMLLSLLSRYSLELF